jgi:hypothetical protein
VRHRRGGERPEPIFMAGNHSGILIVDELGRGHRLPPVGGVRHLGSRGQDLHVNPGPVHQLQPRIELISATGTQATLRVRVGLAEIGHQVEIIVGPVVRMDIDPHVRVLS